jgi:hypothetical protein
MSDRGMFEKDVSGAGIVEDLRGECVRKGLRKGNERHPNEEVYRPLSLYHATTRLLCYPRLLLLHCHL